MKSSKKPAAPPPEPTVLRSHVAPVQALVFLSNPHLATGDAEGHIKLWDLLSHRPRLSWRPANPDPSVKGILSLQTFDQGQAIVSQARGGLVTLWDIKEADPRPVRSFNTGSYHFCKIALCHRVHHHSSLSPPPAVEEPPEAPLAKEEEASKKEEEREGGASDSEDAASNMVVCPTSESAEFQLWDLRAPKAVQTFHPPGSDNRGLCMALHLLSPPASSSSSSPIHVLAAFENGTVDGFDLRTMRHAFTASLTKEPALCMDVGPSCRQGVLGSAGSEIIVFELNLDEHRIKEKQSIKLKHAGIADVRIRADEKLFVTGGWDYRIRAYRYHDGEPLAILKCHTDSVYALDFSPKLQYLASGSKDARVALWELYPPASRNIGRDR